VCVEDAADGGCRITLQVVPGASREGIVGRHGDALRVRVSAPPEKGRANAAVAALLAGVLDVRASDVEIATGHGSRRKTVVVRGRTAAEARARLGL